MKFVKYLAMSLVLGINVYASSAPEKENIVQLDDDKAFEELLKTKTSDDVDTICITLEVRKNKENYNKQTWRDVVRTAIEFVNLCRNLPDENEILFDKLGETTKSIFEMVKDEVSIKGFLDVRLMADKPEGKKEGIYSKLEKTRK